jgi:thymidylate kinase
MPNSILKKIDLFLGQAPFKSIRLTDSHSVKYGDGDVDWLVKSPKKAVQYLKACLTQNNEGLKIVNCRHHATGIRLNFVDDNGAFFYGPDFIFKFGHQSHTIDSEIDNLLGGREETIKADVIYARFLFNFVRGVNRKDLYTSRLARLKSLSERLSTADRAKVKAVTGYPLEYMLDVQPEIDNPAHSIQQKISSLAWIAYSRVVRIFSPIGCTIVFLGVDGAGKSTIISELTKQLDSLCVGTDYYHLKPTLLANNVADNNGATVLPHTRPTYGWFLSYVKALHLYGHYLLSPWCTLKAAVMGRCVIFDRYLYDLYVDSTRFRYAGSSSFVLFLLRFIPKPDVVMYLNGDAELIHNRKPELSVEMINEQDKKYRALFEQLNLDVVNINTCTDLASSIRATLSPVVEIYIDKFERK